MRSGRKLAVLGMIVIATALAAPSAHAFTMEGQAVDQNGVPKFDIEEQAKNFRKSGSGIDTSTNGSVPFAGGSLNFGVQQGSNFGLGGGPGFLGPMNRDTRQDFNRVVTPESLR